MRCAARFQQGKTGNMEFSEISNSRLFNQRVAESRFRTAKDVVGWMGAMQAQDYSMAKWAVGSRLPGSTDNAIQEAFQKGEILRTHIMRPTWHFVSADDICWMLELTAPHVKASIRTRHKELGISDVFAGKCHAVVEKALAAGRHLTRDEISGELGKAKIDVDSSQLYHLLLTAELDGLICSGAMDGKKQTYALLAERAPVKKRLSRDEALHELTVRYFTSHGPATLHDFVWWSGLPVTDARRALNMADSVIVSEKIGSSTYWFSESGSSANSAAGAACLLPAFDEFIISYRDRSPSLPSDNAHRKVVSSNGVFRPIIVLNAQVAGIWKRTTKKDKTLVETFFFKPQGKNTMKSVKQEVEAYGRFLERKTELVSKQPSGHGKHLAL
jgi:hypothetical protein